ncbi:hypothetical protein D187_004076 [Cystobacter fuscus DSM 2262]|uniref:ER-bound oxygenase mpaB/mpaB'/Rubber oxygenase catalytic domain-containing protein n=1 Tax=Cystobacter fuscus (strain ATCC 25194 / DSM 2262 / NBRC 100088 / M29) TaxID=1242864 RepID=S9P1H5_CYSF2|nr:oxygenase MpaB family protein [Cystobacter fuscus]EPX58320.1 hypothetical protein D187_004076 [Cystobacter fuscus DSM 2262]
MLLQRTILDQIQRLDPEKDDHRILFLSWSHDFVWDSRKALEFALFRTYAVPSIGKLLDSTGEFTRRTQKRYDDTDLLIAEFLESGYDSDRGRRAIRRMNQLHHRFDISNDDYLYVLSTFVLEPIRWMERFGWRPYTDHERLAGFHFFKQVGRRMNIHGIPATLEEFQRFNLQYEREHFRYTEESRRVGEATRDLFLGWFLPKQLHGYGAPAVHALMDSPLLRAFGFPEPPSWLRQVVMGAMKTRARLLRLMPERKRPHLTTQAPHPTYPHGYQIEQLGPEGVPPPTSEKKP